MRRTAACKAGTWMPACAVLCCVLAASDMHKLLKYNMGADTEDILKTVLLLVENGSDVHAHNILRLGCSGTEN